MNKYSLRILLIVTITLLFSFVSHPQIFDWAKSINGSVLCNGISIDHGGNSYIVGSFHGTTTFGNIQLTSQYAYNDFFIAKYDQMGNCIWVKQGVADSASYAIGDGISTDSSGNSYVTGVFNNTVSFGSIKLTAPGGSQSIFIAKYDISGNCVWVKQGSTNDGIKAVSHSISVDKNGNSYITGNFQGKLDLGNLQLTSSDSCSVFIAKYSNSGKCLWAKQDSGGTLSWAEGFGIATDADGNCYVTGQFYGTAMFGNYQLSASLKEDNIFIVKYDTIGNCNWAKQSEDTGYYDNALGISVDAEGNSYIEGQFSNKMNFGVIQLVSTGNRNAFTARFDSRGNCIWAKQVNGFSSNGTGISIDANNNCYITGEFFATATLGTTQLNAGDSSNFFIAKYDSNGNNIWAEQSSIIDSNTVARGLGIIADGDGNCYLTGAFNGPTELGNFILIGGGFVAKIGNTASEIYTKKDGLPHNFDLSQNYPNPFNPTTTISYQLPLRSYVTLKVYDILGSEVATLVNKNETTGNYSVNFNASNLSSGIYFYQLKVGDNVQTRKMILLK